MYVGTFYDKDVIVKPLSVDVDIWSVPLHRVLHRPNFIIDADDGTSRMVMDMLKKPVLYPRSVLMFLSDMMSFHDEGFMHWDIHYGNIMMTRRNTLVLIDYMDIVCINRGGVNSGYDLMANARGEQLAVARALAVLSNTCEHDNISSIKMVEVSLDKNECLRIKSCKKNGWDYEDDVPNANSTTEIPVNLDMDCRSRDFDVKLLAEAWSKAVDKIQSRYDDGGLLPGQERSTPPSAIIEADYEWINDTSMKILPNTRKAQGGMFIEDRLESLKRFDEDISHYCQYRVSKDEATKRFGLKSGTVILDKRGPLWIRMVRGGGKVVLNTHRCFGMTGDKAPDHVPVILVSPELSFAVLTKDDKLTADYNVINSGVVGSFIKGLRANYTVDAFRQGEF